METTISGRVFRHLPRFCLFFQAPTLKTREQKHAVTVPAPGRQPPPAGAPATARAGRCPFRPAGSARLCPARRRRARPPFGCFRSRSRLAAEALPARAADVGAAVGREAGPLEPRSGPRAGGRRRGPPGRGGEPGGRLRKQENEDLENTKVTSPVAPASDPEANSSSYRPQMVSPGSEDAAEDLRKAASALEAQALVEQEVLPTDQAQVLNKMAKYQVPQRSGDIVMIQSEHTGAIDILSADLESADLLGDHRKVSPPLMAPPCIWTFAKMKEFKSKLGKEKNSRLVVKRGEVVTIRVPTHPEGKRVCWEFATDDYDIGFGVYFDWTPVTSTDITVQVSDSSEDEDEDEEEEEEIEDPVPVGDVERGSRSSLRGRYGEVMPVYRRDSHRDVQAGSHDYPGEGIYLLKFDNSYSLLRNKTLYFHIYYTS
uniref:Transmembrane p24 trafficking protein family member 8 n=1 Tax=Equus asinus TaxID=9793 RepID=A0A9L0JTC2_EQUAS